VSALDTLDVTLPPSRDYLANQPKLDRLARTFTRKHPELARRIADDQDHHLHLQQQMAANDGVVGSDHPLVVERDAEVWRKYLLEVLYM
jgi:hypothetical protein